MVENVKQKIVSALPYRDPFHFVTSIEEVDEDHIIGTYQLKNDEYFYQGHFPGNPVTPGVILTEIAAQIGLVSFGIYLSLNGGNADIKNLVPLFSSSNVDFYKPVYPGEKVVVHSNKEYFRFNKLKCQVSMMNANEEIVLKGAVSGMIVSKETKGSNE